MYLVLGSYCRGYARELLLMAGALLLLVYPGVMYAQQDFPAKGVAEYVLLDNASEAQHGALVVLTDDGYQLASEFADERIIGVVSLAPSLAISSVGSEGAVPLVTSGPAQVLITGSVAVGDYVTSTSVPGVGQVADQSGFVIGRALNSFDPGEASEQGLVTVEVNPRFAWSTSITARLQGLFTNPGESLAILPQPLRYAMAVLVILLALIAGYFIYTRMSVSTVNAVGRNPLASRSIIVLAGMQSLVVIGLVLAGFALAYFILTF